MQWKTSNLWFILKKHKNHKEGEHVPELQDSVVSTHDFSTFLKGKEKPTVCIAKSKTNIIDKEAVKFEKKEENFIRIKAIAKIKIRIA